MRSYNEALNADLVREGKGPAGFPDRMRTNRNHAGEALEDGYNLPGLVLCLLGTVALALTLVSAGSGFYGWTIVAGLVTLATLGGGIGWVLLEHRRVKIHEGLGLRDRVGH